MQVPVYLVLTRGAEQVPLISMTIIAILAQHTHPRPPVRPTPTAAICDDHDHPLAAWVWGSTVECGLTLWITSPCTLREIDGTKHPRSSPSRVQRQQASSRCIHKLVAPSPLPIRSPFSEISASLIKERHHHQPAGPRYNTTLAHPIRLILCNSPHRQYTTLSPHPRPSTPPHPNTQAQWQQSCHTTLPNKTCTTATYHHPRRRWTTPSARFLPSRTSSASQTRARPPPRRTPRFPSVGSCRQSTLVPFFPD